MKESNDILLRQKTVANVKRVVIKVGTRLLTDTDRISAVIDQIATLRKTGREVILVSSGAVGLGMQLMKLKRRPPQLSAKQSLAAIGQSELMRLYAEAAAKHGFSVAQLLLTVNDLRNRESHINIMDCLQALLHQGVLPIINENDSVATKELRVGDNDNLSALIAAMTRAELTLILTTVDGLWKTENGKLTERIPTLDKLTPEVLGFASGTDDAAFSIGGMKTKLDAAQTILSVGDALWIVDGREPRILERVFSGENCGTLFLSPEKSMASKKRWIRFFTPKRGKLIVNGGAVEGLLTKKGSLLAAGLLAVQGNFSAGDAVDIAGPDFKRIAVGLVRFGMNDCAAMGDLCRYADLHEKEHLPSDSVVVHRDELIFT